MPTAYPPISKYSTLFELSDFKNSLKSRASAGIAIEGPSQEFECPQPLLNRAGQPVLHRIVRIRQARDGKLRAIQPEVLDLILRSHTRNYSLRLNQSAASGGDAHTLGLLMGASGVGALLSAGVAPFG